MIKISVIIIAHDQGQFLYRTIRGIFSSYEKSVIEVICCLDTPSPETLKFVEIAKNKFPQIKVLNTEHLDNGLSRNEAAKTASGEYLLFLNAGDIILPNTILNFYKYAKASERNIYVPTYTVDFDFENQKIEKHESARTFSQGKELLFMRNPWGEVFFIKKDLFEENCYQATDIVNKIKFSTQSFFEEAIANSCKILVVPETVAFTRHLEVDNYMYYNFADKGTKLFKQAKTSRNLEDNSKTEEISNLNKPKLDTKESEDNRFFLKKIISALFPKFYLRLFSIKEKLLGKTKTEESYPNWLILDWKNANKFDDLIFPIKFGSSDIWFQYNQSLPRLYDSLINVFEQNIDYLVFCPWIKTGGADKLTLNFVRAISEIFPKSQIGLITTECERSKFPDNLPENIKIIEFGILTEDLNEKEREVFFMRFLMQKKVKNIVNINSNLMFQVMKKFKSTLSKDSKMYCFCFSPSEDKNGKYSGYAFKYLPYIADSMKYVLTDNLSITSFLTETFGIEEQKFKCLYQPISELKEREFEEEKEGIDILWASRIDYEKLPQVLEKIVKNSDSQMRFHIFGKSILDKSFNIGRVAKYKNARYYGGFENGLANIPDKVFDLYLYTSAFDGMPNAVLEAVALGLPVISSDVGGIHEVIENGHSGLLVKDVEKHSEYLEKIKVLMDNRNLLKKYSQNAQKKLSKQHSWESYINNLKTIFK